MADNAQLIAQCEARAKEWLSPAFDEETRKEVHPGICQLYLEGIPRQAVLRGGRSRLS